MKGHLEICKLIIENVEDKNPGDKLGWTPLHLAAKNGHLEICKLIIANVDDKKPLTRQGKTPRNVAHRDVRHLFETDFKCIII